MKQPKKATKKAAKKRARGRKTSVKTSVTTSAVVLAPQPHGGALQVGGTPGNPGGGRPRSEVRAAALEGAAAAVPILREMLRDDGVKQETRVQAANTLLKYGLGTIRELSVDEVRERLRRTVEAIRLELDPETAARVLERIKPLWVN